MGDEDGAESAAAEGHKRRRDRMSDSLGSPVYTGRPEPPYEVVITDFLWGCYTLDPESIRPFIPPELHPIPEYSAFVAMYKVPMGWGIAPSTMSWLCLSISDHDSPDTSEAVWTPVGYMTPPFNELLDDRYGLYEPGDCHTWYSDGLMHGVIVADGKEIVRATIRPTGPETPGMASNDSFVGTIRNGRHVGWLASIAGTSRVADFVSLEITDDAPAVYKAMRPASLNWAADVPFMPTSISSPRALFEPSPERAAAAPRAALMALFDRSGRAACVVRTDGEIVHQNVAAARLLGAKTLQRMTALRLSPLAEHRRLIEALVGAAQRAADSVPAHFVLGDNGGARPLVLQVAPVDPLIAGPDTALVLIADPAQPLDAAPVEALQLLGLTRSEARAAALVGGGLSPKEAAGRIGVAESTVRWALRIAYDKLAIKRQSELVRIVARLSFL